jgi:uncharacterized protein YbbC (DUF1343 family)
VAKVASGLDCFREGEWRRFRGARLGLLCNQASLDAGLRTAARVVTEALPGGLRALFGPQHGYAGVDQDNMVETDHGYDPDLAVPVYSLYADRREPRPGMLEEIDVLMVDLQDVGTRVYTFASTLLNCMRAAARAGRRVVVLDRPNPLGGEAVEGNLLAADMHSFVGPARIPMRHGLTMGEMALYFKEAFRMDVDLDVVPMAGWRRGMLWRDTGLRWVMPSPNMPLPETAMVYPGQVLWEGTNVSEGRGTCRPFEIFGAPFLRPERLLERVPPPAVEGALLQPFSFKPTFHKWAEQECRGFHVHVLDAKAFQPYLTSLALLSAILREPGERFAWRDPPYEYETERLPIDLILGDAGLRKAVEKGVEPLDLWEDWQGDLSEFREGRRGLLLYPP